MYRVKQTLHTDQNPTAETFSGAILPETASGYVLAGKDLVIDEETAARFGLLGTDYIEPYDPEQAAKDREAAAIATHGSQERAMTGVVESVPEPETVSSIPIETPEGLRYPFPGGPVELEPETISDAGAHTGPPVSNAVELEAAKANQPETHSAPKKPGRPAKVK